MSDPTYEHFPFGCAAFSVQPTEPRLVIRHMSDSIVKVITPLFVSVLFAATSAAQSATRVAVVGEFLKSWNSHDAKAFDRLFAQDAISVPVAETRVGGHDDVIKDFEQIHTTWAKKTTIIARDIEVQSVRPNVAIILFHAPGLVFFSYAPPPRQQDGGYT
jgi:uncharacterized protein (TIGR02246 family)